MKKDFNEWLSTFRSSISDYKYYVDFDKVYENVDSIKIELNILNTLIGSKNFDNEFKRIANEYPKVIKCIPVLIAVRRNEIEISNEVEHEIYDFDNIYDMNIDKCLHFLEKTGLKNLIQNRLISNLVDYVTGVEVGLDSHGRKSRGGHLMEDLLENYIKELNVEYYKEMKTSDIEKKWNIDLSKLTNMGDVTKRFDFVVKTNTQVYVFETNFYTGGGSKLNETARSYKTISNEVNEIDGITFVWVTDGKGWLSARHNLKETYDVMDNVINIKDLEEGILYNIIGTIKKKD